MQEYIDLTIDFGNRNDRINGITLDRVTTRSYDTAIKFRIEIINHTLDDTYDVKILSKYHKSGLSVMTTLGDSLEITDGKLIYTPKVNLITEADYVRNFLYLSKDGLGLDMAQFNYQVDVSQIGEITLDIRQAYDESYETLITEFEQALEGYKLTLPQADSVRAEIDVILTQFGVDSQVKLNQYDADAQKAIADNQTAFGVAESGRQDSYVQSEDNRNQASNQAITDWGEGADALLETVESNESARVISESAREISETDRVSSETTRKSSEATRVNNENERESAEVIRLANEVDRVNAESVRSEFYEGFDGEIATLKTEITKKANRNQEVWVKPTLINGFSGYLKYRKTQFNELQIDNTGISGGSIGNVIFVLPPEYRPAIPKVFIVGTSFSANFAKITISIGGNVILTSNGGGNPVLANITLPLD